VTRATKQRGVGAASRFDRLPRPALLFALALLLAPGRPGAARAEEIQPDRPETTESARLVPRGSFQLETGIAYSKERRAGTATERTLGTEADLRIGVTRQLEVDIQGEPFARVRGPQDDTGFGDVVLGFKYRFVEAVEDESWPPSLAVKPFVKLPVAGEPIGTGRADFGLLLLASFALPWDFELEVNVGAAAIGQTRSSGYLAQGLASASLSRDLAPKVFGFVELLLNSRGQRDDRGQFAVNTGLVYRMTPTLAVDAGVQASLLGQGPDYVFRTGLSVLFGP
jgi:hypothetical protein